ncbi:hypothetical protein BHE74_00054521 [Ensete ventricosum]|nr:hypothetical protein BHE74_00054521 [Ensete ventricosum]
MMGGVGQVVSPRYQDSRWASNSPPGAAPHGRRMKPAISFFRPLGMWSGPHSRAALVSPLTNYAYRESDETSKDPYFYGPRWPRRTRPSLRKSPVKPTRIAHVILTCDTGDQRWSHKQKGCRRARSGRRHYPPSPWRGDGQ